MNKPIHKMDVKELAEEVEELRSLNKILLEECKVASVAFLTLRIRDDLKEIWDYSRNRFSETNERLDKANEAFKDMLKRLKTIESERLISRVAILEQRVDYLSKGNGKESTQKSSTEDKSST